MFQGLSGDPSDVSKGGIRRCQSCFRWPQRVSEGTWSSQGCFEAFSEADGAFQESDGVSEAIQDSFM